MNTVIRTSDNMPSSAMIYMRTLGALENDTKLELIHLLSLSVLNNANNSHAMDYDLFHCFKGNWGEDMTADEYCSMLRTEGVNTIVDI